MAQRKSTNTQISARSTNSIDWAELEAFRNTLPAYRRFETYRFLATGWDIVRAHYILKVCPREPQLIDVKMFADNYGFSFFPGGAKESDPLTESILFSVDIENVMSNQIDLTRPLIIALIKMEKRERPGVVQIDGLHRIFKAARLGRADLPAYVLTSDEEQLCRL